MGIASGWEKRVIRTNITYAKRTVRIFSVSPQSRSLFSTSFQTFCSTSRTYLQQSFQTFRLTAGVYLNTQQYRLYWLHHRVQRKSVLQPAIRASCGLHALAHKSFQLAPKLFLISRIDYNPSVISISPKNSTCPIGQVKNKNHQPDSKIHYPRAIGHNFLCTLHPSTLCNLLFNS